MLDPIPVRLGATNAWTAKSATFTVAATDRGNYFDNTGTYTINFGAAATLGAGFSFYSRTVSGAQTFDPNGAETINGAATLTESTAGVVWQIISTGTAWEATQMPAGQIQLQSTTSASSATTGALVVGTGTAATSTGVGGGNINAGGTLAVGGTATVTGATIAKGFLSLSAAGSAPAAQVHIINEPISAASWTTNGIGIRCGGATYTDATGTGTLATVIGHVIAAPTFAATNLTVTMTDAVTLNITNRPVAGTNVTITNGYTLNLGAGMFRSQDTTEATAVTGPASFFTGGGIAHAKRRFGGTIGSTFKGNVDAGVQDATAAVSGQVGEVISSVVSAVAVAGTGNPGNITSITLTAGAWIIHAWGVITGGATGLTVNTTAQMSVVTTTATNGTVGSTMTQQSILALLANGLSAYSLTPIPVNINTSTTYFFTEQCTYAAGSPTASGTIYGERIR